jgi:anti-sigma regulatory factor (Ser/Thr protein kinase)
LLAVGEAITNAIEHGSRCDPTKLVSVHASVRNESLAVTVSDRGSWVEPSTAPATPSQQRGRGLRLMKALADDVDIVESNQGTLVTMRFDMSEQIAARPTGTD